MGCPGKCNVRSFISSEHAKDFFALWVGSSAHRAVNAPLIDGGHAPHSQLGIEGEEAMMGGLYGLVARVWL
jgi:hypothetical protein